MFNYLANPTRFRKIASFILPFLEVIFLLSLGYGLYLALLVSPADYQQGDAVRIMYVHVPSAWLALSSYLSRDCGALNRADRHRLCCVNPNNR